MLITNFGITQEVVDTLTVKALERGKSIPESWAKNPEYLRKILHLYRDDEFERSPGGVFLDIVQLDNLMNDLSPIWNVDWTIWKEMEDLKATFDDKTYFPEYGYVDQPDDVFDLYPQILTMPIPLAVCGYWHDKAKYSDWDLSNRGWPTYKNGEYYGKHKNEYGQVTIDRVFNYHVYKLTPKEPNS